MTEIRGQMTEDIEFGSGNAECGKKAKGIGHSVKDRGEKKDDRGY